LEERKKFHKLHMIYQVFGEEKEIPEIAYGSPRFWRRERSFKNYI